LPAADFDGRDLDFLIGGGGTGALIRAQDWSRSPLGKPETWPQSLRTVVGLLLSSKFPMFVAWGPDLGFIYNDPYSKILGSKHPSALGQPFPEVWADIWADISPLVDAALRGEASYHENLPLLTTRMGREEQAWFSFGYSPIRDESGTVSGMFCVVTETTQAMLDERRQTFRLHLEERLRGVASADEITAIAAEAVGRALDVARVGYGEIDQAEQHVIVARDWSNGRIESVTGRHWLDGFGAPLIAELKAGHTIAVDDVSLDPMVAESATAFATINTRSVLAVPLVKEGRFTALLFLHHPEPRNWTADEIALVSEVAERTWAAVERARAEASLRRRESRLRAVFDQAAAGLARTDLAGKFLEVNDRYCEIVGRSREDLLALRMQDLTHPEDLTSNIPLFEKATAGGPSFDIEKRYLKRDGSTVWVRNSVSAIRSVEGTVDGVLAVCVDLTKKREAEARLRESEDQLRRGLAAARMVVWSYDLENELVTRSENADEIFGTGSCSETFTRRMPQEDAKDDRARLDAAISGDVPRYESEFRYCHPDGRLLWLFNQGQVVRNANGTPTKVHGVCLDVTARKSAELELKVLNETLEQRISNAVAAQREADALYRAYFENSPEALFVVAVETDGSFVVEEINPAHEAGIGLKLEEIRGRRIDEVLPETAAQQVLATYRHVTETGAIYQYREEYDLNGDPQHWDTSIVPIRDEHGRVVRLIGSSRNVTRQVVAEEALRQSQKMEAMGQLTGGVAHDFNNLLTPIVGALDMLQRRGVGGEREQRLIAGAAQSAERARILVQRLLAFARRQPLQPVAVDLPKLVAGMAELISSTTGPQIKVVVDAPQDVPPANADPNQLEMAVLNLAVNARDAMPEGGTLRISVEAATVGRQHRSQLKPGRYLLLSVADTGTGMDEATLARAVEPFFSTKGVGKGTGLGLSMVHGLALQLGGTVTIRSTVGVGTNVELWLPQGEIVSVDRDVVTTQQTELAGRGMVLLVDDEDAVRLSTADMLIELGYQVAEASSAEEALRLLNRGLNPHLVVTDHLMPGMSGTELARILLSERHGIKVLVISGYAESAGFAPDLPRLAKPFLNSELAASLAAI
jgi:PAS domain S-box-containing protein